MQFAGILDEHDAVASLGDFGQKGIDQGGFAGGGAAGDQDVLALADSDAEQLGLLARHDAGLHIVLEREDGDGGAADGETRRHHHGRNQAFKSLAAFGQFGRDAGRSGMHLGADMVGDQADDALGVGGCDPVSGVFQPARQTVDPKPAVGIEHDLDDAGIFEIGGDGRTERGAQHPRAAGESFGTKRRSIHIGPRIRRYSGVHRGRVERAGFGPKQQGWDARRAVAWKDREAAI